MEGENFESTQVESVETSVPETVSESYDNASASGTEGASVDTSSQRESISARSDEGTTFELYTDPTTGKVEFRANTNSPEEEEGTSEEESGVEENYQEEYQEDTNQYEEETDEEIDIPKYSLDEFTYAMANGIVDDNRVPDEYQAQYADFKISQAKAAYQQKVQRAQQEQAMAAQQAQQQATPEARIQANKEFYANLEAEATRLALQDLGLTGKNLEDLDYEDGGEEEKARIESAKNWHKNRLMTELQQRYASEQAYRQGQQRLYEDIGEFTKQIQASEKHFAEIDKMMATAWQNMPTKYGSVVQNALIALGNGTITAQQAQVVKKYYEDTRKMFYAQRNGLSTKPKQIKKPPVVERAGNGQEAAKSGPDYSALRKADARGKKAWLADFMKNIEL